MSNIKEYTLDVMLEWLKEHYRYRGYETKDYSPEFSPARVPLYCIIETEFNWSNVPGKDEMILRQFLAKLPNTSWINNAVFSKSDDDTRIIVSSGEHQLTISRKDERLIIKTDSEEPYILMVEEKRNGLYFFDEIVIEITTESVISKDNFFPDLPVETENDTLIIPGASPVRFYKYYFPNARIYYAYPGYVEENDGFKKFKAVCKKRDIGL